MYDVIIIGTATRDGFFEGIDFLKSKTGVFGLAKESVCLSVQKLKFPKLLLPPAAWAPTRQRLLAARTENSCYLPGWF